MREITGEPNFLEEVGLRKGKVLGSEKGKGLQCELCYEQRTEFERGLTIGLHFDINVIRTSLGCNFNLTLGGLHQGEILILALGRPTKIKENLDRFGRSQHL